MSLGHVGKWLIEVHNVDAVDQATLNAIEKQGYEIVSISSQRTTGRAVVTVIYARYRGGMRQPSGG